MTTPVSAPEKKKFRLKYYINYLLVGAFFLIFLIMDMTMGLRTSSVQLLVKIAYSIILAVSLNMVVGFLGELSLGHAGFMCVGAYIGCFCANYLHKVIPSPLVVLILAMLIGGVVAAVFGFLIGLPTLRLKGDYLAIATLAFGEIVRTVFKNLNAFGGALGLTTKRYDNSLYIIAFLVVLFTLFVTQNLKRSKHGRAIEAIRDNEIAARAMGVNVTYYKLMVFIIAAFFAGVAGVIYGHLVTPVSNTFFSFNYSIEILVMVVLGGMGNVSGSIIAATLLTFINVQLTTQLSGDMAALKYLIYALILIAMVLWNNAPALRDVREKFSLHRLLAFLNRKLHPAAETPDAPEIADWDKIPTKIPMDALLSTDIKPDHTFEADKPEKPSK
ncbi:MAG: branched-chain amino acid ABC transporter permease [Clostridia bacterium]|nr:branched-chain amino acid ABC transporter permease [Clostridia bacterium]